MTIKTSDVAEYLEKLAYTPPGNEIERLAKHPWSEWLDNPLTKVFLDILTDMKLRIAEENMLLIVKDEETRNKLFEGKGRYACFCEILDMMNHIINFQKGTDEDEKGT